MDRTDFVKNRIDVIRNVYTLYSYAKSDNIEDKNWAIQRFKQGHWYVVEPFGDLLLFAPSRFVGYKDNTRAKHMENPGDGTHTNSKFYELKLYKEAQNDFLVQKFQSFMKGLGIEKNTAKFFIPYDLDVSDLKCRHKCYFVSPTHCEGQKEIAWKDFLTKGIIAIGWKDIDYSNKSIEDIMQEYKGDADALSAFPLIKQIKSGDIICCTHNKYGLWGIGIATSSYKYEKGIHYAGVDDHDVEWNYSHYIEVAWLCYNKSGFIPTSNLHIQPSEKQWNPYGTLSQKEIPQYINRYIFKDTDIMDSKKQYADFIDLLKNNKNLILTGAPGTGKTFLAREIANAMGAEVEFVQFHPSYDYTDFVEGLRPTPPDQNGNIGFERKDGVFKAFCRKAMESRTFNCEGDQSVVELSNPQYQINNTGVDSESINYALKWLLTQNGAKIESIGGGIVYTLIIDDRNKMYIRIPSGNVNYISQNAIVRYLKTGIVGHNSYEASIGEFIKKNFPSYTNKDVNYPHNDNSSQDYQQNSNDTFSFKDLYAELKQRIRNNEVILYTVYPRSPMELQASGNELMYKKGDSFSNYVNEDYVKKIFTYYKNRDISDITRITNQDFYSIIGNTLDYTYYRGIVQELLNMSREKTMIPEQNLLVDSWKKDILQISEEKDLTNEGCTLNESSVKKDFVFIIDEINRGEISKIFGELFFSVDPGYRGKKGLVKTQYQNMIVDKEDPFFEGFYIPENVYIIGTMNDIDRSVESMDFAMRRRFAWKEIKANDNTGMLDDLGILKSEVVEKMNRLNDKIWNENSNDGIEGLGVAYHIGGAYFRKLKLYLNEDYSNKEEAYRALWENHLRGVLFEYLRGSMNAAESMRELEKAYYAES